MVSNTELHMSTPTAAEMKKKRGEEYEFGGPVGELNRIAPPVSGQKLAQPSVRLQRHFVGDGSFGAVCVQRDRIEGQRASHIQWQRAGP